MKRNFNLYLLFFLFFSVAQTTRGQELSDFTQLEPEDFTQLSLPSLDLLFENAKGAPSYELAQVQCR